LYLSLYGTGIRGCSSSAAVAVRVGEVTIPVLYAGAHSAGAGLDQVNVRLSGEAAPSGQVRISVRVNGVASNTVVLLFE
jgi:uncharacterized protein (TIGR03437 family)